MDKLKEDTVSADRKERIIFDPSAWRKSDKSGRRTSAITSRQNFDNEKFTRKAKQEDQVDESAVQTTGTSQIDYGTSEHSDLIKKGKDLKSNSPQIEFVTGTEKKAVQQMDNQPRQGVRKIAETLVKKAFNQVKEGAYKGLEAEDKPGKVKTAVVKTHPKAVAVDTVEGWKDQKKPVKEDTQLEEGSGYDDNRTGFAKKPREDDEGHPKSSKPFRKDFMNDRPHTVHIGGKPWKKFSNGHQANAAVKTLKAQGKDAVAIGHFKEDSTKEETNMSKTYADFMQQLQEYNASKDGVYRHKGTYGGSYDSNDDEDDETPKKPAAPAVKRGRGRPAGSKSGANQKVTTGKSYGGIATHTLSLPNSK